MKSKLKIADLKVTSFVTAIEKANEHTVKGGARSIRLNRTDCCTAHPRFCND